MPTDRPRSPGPTGRRPAPRSEVERWVANRAQLWGWRHHHFPRSGVPIGEYPDGFPSEVLLRDGRLLFVTISAKHGGITPLEQAWINDLTAAEITVETLIVRRDDLPPLTAALRLDGSTNQHPINEKAPGSRHSPGAQRSYLK